ncbi:MAG: GDP-mannose 4,6-dehydratase [Patescibacteria group bacterium]|mgnify:CR=1 FL=1
MTSDVILVTGAAGFIGSNLVDRLLAEDYQVVGIDNLNDYYEPKIKERNLASALLSNNFKLHRIDIRDFNSLKKIFEGENPDKIIHLAAAVGVRSSIVDPQLYAAVNTLGTVNLLKLATQIKVKQFIFGSSSSVYGNSKKIPFSEDDQCLHIISPYAASKRSAEFFVETFSKNFDLNATILRFFTVYGERGRPDMAPALFCEAILKGESIKQFGNGESSRDYTYIDDIVEGVVQVLDKRFDCEIINLGNNHPITLTNFIETLERVIGKKAKIKKLPPQLGDVKKTWADIEKAKKILGWQPRVNMAEGLKRYVQWLQKN